MIQRARDLGIVTITATDPSGAAEAVGRRLQEAFGLERAIVVPARRPSSSGAT
jgi:DNA-binding transcriptional regulator LsrR (DeoR family)